MPPPLVGSEPARTGASGLRLQVTPDSTQPGPMQPLHQPQEHTLPRVPRQQSVDDPPARPHDLARHLDQGHAEGAELHPKQRPLLRTVLLRPPALLGEHQPGLFTNPDYSRHLSEVSELIATPSVRLMLN